jgi:N-acetylneuraminic acid mutarotase
LSKGVVFLLVLVFLTASFVIPIQAVEASEDSWATKASLPSTGSLGAAVLNGMIYVVGIFRNRDYDPLKYEPFLYEYNPVEDSWVAKSPMPTLRSGFGIAACQGRIYVIGGKVIEGGSTGINEAYDPATDMWETRAPMPTARQYMKANEVNGKIYVIGGWIESPYMSLFENEVYDPANDSWTTKAPIRYPVFGYTSAVLDGKIYVIAGQTDGHPPLGPINRAWNQIYDAEADRWSQGAPLPSTADMGYAAGATTGLKAPKRIYVLGGDRGMEPDNSNHIYDPASDVWSVGTPMPTNRSSLAVAVVDDLLYAIGGHVGWRVFPGSSTTVVEEYTPSGYVSELPQPAVIVISPTILVGVAVVSGIVVAAVFLIYSRKVRKTRRHDDGN